MRDAPALIEQYLPVAKLSAESYKERKAVSGQTLTGLGKWWGRKPLILVRATLLGLLLPQTDDAKADADIFLKLLTMDDAGLERRRSKPIKADKVLEVLLTLPPEQSRRYVMTGPDGQPMVRALDKADKDALQMLVFKHLPYAEKLTYADRPEHLSGPDKAAWKAINAHLGTQAQSLPELVEELGLRRFGHRPRVGDAFAGGGSIPFEAARIGADAYASDLNPVAGLLTWAALNLVGGGPEVAERVQKAQREVFEAVDKQVTAWGIEHNEQGWRADAYLYCVEVRDPESSYMVPLAPSWVIADKGVCAELVADPANKRYDIRIIENATAAQMKRAKDNGTVKDARLTPPNGGPSTPIRVLREQGSGLRQWENDDVVPRPDDVFQERLYCIRWVETYSEGGKIKTRRHYRASTEADQRREARVLELLRERFADWQEKGFIPSSRIESGYNTDQPMRERGWSHWQHLFTPRQLLVHGLFQYFGESEKVLSIGNQLLVYRLANWNSRLSQWLSSQGGGIGGGKATYYNNALNTFFNFSVRPMQALYSTQIVFNSDNILKAQVELKDARSNDTICDFWITDPPYADAVNYDEVSEFFLAWYEKHIPRLFPEWYGDSKRALAVKGNDAGFRQSMVEVYANLTRHMPDNGAQVVMFTHQDAAVWADLALILWAAGLRVTAAWTISTETDSALKAGNYVQGTVLLVLRKRISTEAVFEDELLHEIEQEVVRQLDTMKALDDSSEPNFGDADYQLAAYAAALRVLTANPIEGIDPEREISRPRVKGEVSLIQKLIEQAVAIAVNYLIPRGIERDLWLTLTPHERYYLKGLEVEAHAEYRSGVYMELARGIGASDYAELFGNSKANTVRLATPSELGRKGLEKGRGPMGGTLLRHTLFAVGKTSESGDPQEGKNWLRHELGSSYWADRARVMGLLTYLESMGRIEGAAHWQEDAHSASLLRGVLENDRV
ncbi:DUF1156 domain-containing protein (plasmid) [Deinococcus psychrotolerans]|uniref:DUF1156 domain-containing protein n=1 Tax=Deinococcus psychrotolerans TaxID=2489213 RepID=A0A3G8YJ33_9DEIO|nr:DUF1156 domain-containing protein [Deinococcus psychrotolerans]